MIKAIIVDDEPYCCEALATLLEQHCPEITISDICYSGELAIHSIKEQNPQIVFLDIEMPRMNGFEMLEKIRDIGFAIIFTTSYNEYAIKAIRFSAMDYLLKPVDREELQNAVKKTARHLASPLPQQLEILLQKMNRRSPATEKIALPTMEGFQMVPLDSIISCSSDSNYTVFQLKGKQKLVVSRTLKDIEEMLGDFSFVRVHHSYLVNLNEISRYIKGEGGYVVMSDGSSIDVSRSKKDFLLKKIAVKK